LPSERLAAAAKAQRPAPARERPPIDPNLPPDHPLEPGSAIGRTGSSPAERIAASEAALGPARPPAKLNPEGNADFVAAARRAAQAAQTPSDSVSGSSTTDNTNASSSSRVGDRVRSVLVGASVVVLAAGAAHVAIPLIEPYLTTGPGLIQSANAPASVQSAKAPEILPMPKSAKRLSPAPTTTGSTGQLWNAPGYAVATGPATDTPPADPGVETSNNTDGNAEAPRDAQASVQGQANVQGQADITGAIPPKPASPEEPNAVPLPLNRPAGESQAVPQSRLAAAAASGNPAAAYELAVRHVEGRGVPRSYEDAARWLALASKEGIVPAQFRLGSLYEKGLGVKKDLNAARRLYTAAAEKGSAKAMHNLAVLHAEGIDGKPNYEVAVQWFRKAADRNVADSQYNLGVLYARGVGLEQNLAESYKWFALAALRGDKEAGRKRDEIAAQLDANSLIAAKLAIKTWTPKPEPEGATTVAVPAGGWDQAPRAPAAKRRVRDVTPMKLGPG
jgi:localization factor PodJL